MNHSAFKLSGKKELKPTKTSMILNKRRKQLLFGSSHLSERGLQRSYLDGEEIFSALLQPPALSTKSTNQPPELEPSGSSGHPAGSVSTDLNFSDEKASLFGVHLDTAFFLRSIMGMPRTLHSEKTSSSESK